MHHRQSPIQNRLYSCVVLNLYRLCLYANRNRKLSVWLDLTECTLWITAVESLKPAPLFKIITLKSLVCRLVSRNRQMWRSFYIHVTFYSHGRLQRLSWLVIVTNAESKQFGLTIFSRHAERLATLMILFYFLF